MIRLVLKLLRGFLLGLPLIVFWWMLVAVFASVPTIPWDNRLPLIVAAGPLVSFAIAAFFAFDSEKIN